MKRLYPFIAIILLISSCKEAQQKQLASDERFTHKVVVEEIIHTTSYTYVLAKENDELQWLAVPKMEISVGETYFFQNPMEMKDFQSTELNRTFESVMFLDKLETIDSFGKNTASASMAGHTDAFQASIQDTTKYPLEGGVTVAELFSNRENYSDKVVKVKGKVTKFNENIMGKNWIHLNDGTNIQGNYDFVITTTMDVNIGEVVVIEGKISVDKDFGYGYFYKVLMEEGKILVGGRKI